MKEYQVFKEKARQLRKGNKSLDEICQILNLNKTTVYYWIKDIEANIQRRPASAKSGQKMRESWTKKREEYYNEGMREYKQLLKTKHFRDFILLYLCEGYKRNRNSVNISNSDPEIIRVAYSVLKSLTNKTPRMGVQVHLDNDFEEVKSFWASLLEVDKDSIKVYPRKVNITTRNGRLKYGIFQVMYCDTRLRSRIQAWLDILKKEWSPRSDLN